MNEHGFFCEAWQDEKEAYAGYLAALLMSLGPDSPVLADMIGCCTGSDGNICPAKDLIKSVRLCYAVSLWHLLT